MKIKNTISALIGALCFAALPHTANAALIGFVFDVSGNTNSPTLTLKNTSDSASITGLTFSIGDTSRNFHVSGYSSQPPTTSFGSVSMTFNSIGTRLDVLDMSFSGFGPGAIYQTLVDVDRDNSNTSENYRSVFFGNGDATANALLTVLFSSNETLTAGFPESPGTLPGSSDTYRLVASAGASSNGNSVPEPSTLLLAGLALTALAARKRSLM
ncbi:MAG: hypothetical protein CVU19_02230 [Betaproteobacteria bacterium HGW-Betaproteobacteria-13]|jgi:hypothetical protein|uniref:Ice-binding protein C-terminal domain-containing protein n=1 Tax=Parazoarcus communis TaxID=41977 RepID=A0A2U8GX83_9RHOO|nr:PEP-CTERM sorting domain-containing protein [Parazoarcus communis]AWI78329.1 hypothetical protein CEW87_02550 [Parazoarcus communis]PKO82327.1 MAG: hypothetical protein CVU19_02230 [Betaproteobacteria bacterium HGW-Betaproteobacteria-13]